MDIIEKKFYNLFWSDATCQSIFSNHKGLLLENEVELIVSKEKFYAKRLVLTNSLERIGTSIAKRAENENIEIIHNLQKSARKYFDDDKLLNYVEERFGKTINKITKEFEKDSGWFKILMKLISSFDDEKDLFKLLSSYYLIPKRITNKEELLEYIEVEFKTQLTKFIKKENLYDLAISIDLISTYYNIKIKHNLLYATKHYTDILYDNENYQKRLELFDNLYEIGVLNGSKIKSYYECVNCKPDTFNGVLTTNIKPSKLNLKCPSCSNELLYIVAYELNENIYKHIIHNDGLLFFAIQYLLDINNYSYKLNQTFLKDVEIDFCLLDNNENIYELIEIKMFKTNRPHDTQVGNIKTAIRQMKDAIDKLAKDDLGYKTIKHSLITNIYNDAIYKEANTVLKNDLKEYNISIYSINDFYYRIKD